MTSGVLGIIACPMLEDELIHLIRTDEENKVLYVIENDHSKSLRHKLDISSIGYVLLDEKDFFSGIIKVDKSRFNIVIYMNNLGLHAEPKQLKVKIEEEIMEIQPHVDAIGLYYGLCGNYGWDITSWCKENGFKPTEVFRDMEGRVCDDCVGVCVGGGPRYLELEKTYTGMLYVTPAIASNWLDFLAAGDMMKGIESMNKIESLRELGIRTPDDYMRWMFEMCGYKNMVQIDSGIGNRDDFDVSIEDMSRRLNLKILQAEPGWATLQPAEDLYAACRRNLCQ